MGLPTKAKTWNWTSNQVSTFVSLLATSKDILYGYKVAIAGMSGATVKGSSVGATSSMDAVDRWSSAAALGARVANRTTNACTWIVFTLSGFGGADVLFAMTGNSNSSCFIAVSPSGSFTVGNTQCPTAPDEIPHSNNVDGSLLHSTTASANRIWSIGVTSDGTGIYMLVARSGVENFYCGIQMITETVEAPSSFSPPIVVFSNVAGAAMTSGSSGITNFLSNGSTYKAASYADGGSGDAVLTVLFGTEAYGGSNSAATRLTFAPELQGGGNLLPEISAWSETGLVRGKLGWMTDLWFAYVSGATGDTYPNDTSRQFLQWNVLALPWDGSVVVLT